MPVPGFGSRFRFPAGDPGVSQAPFGHPGARGPLSARPEPPALIGRSLPALPVLSFDWSAPARAPPPPQRPVFEGAAWRSGTPTMHRAGPGGMRGQIWGRFGGFWVRSAGPRGKMGTDLEIWGSSGMIWSWGGRFEVFQGRFGGGLEVDFGCLGQILSVWGRFWGPGADLDVQGPFSHPFM